jgi:hypothetical protein
MVIYSQVGTPYYTAVVPRDQTFEPEAFFFNVVSRGGFERAGVSSQIITLGTDEDAMIVEFEDLTTKLIYTSNDIRPFVFYLISTEYGGESTFSSLNLESGVLSIGDYGIINATQNAVSRIDLKIPDQVFTIKNNDNGNERVSSARDYRQELVYFSYPQRSSPWKFPTQTLVYSYRENNWAIFVENYTSHGTFRRVSSFSWATIPYRTWAEWTVPWGSGKTAARYPDIAAGNQQGFVMLLDQGTADAPSGYIQSISGNTIESPDHCLSVGDYLFFVTCHGTTNLTGTIRRVEYAFIGSAPDSDRFIIDGDGVTGAYLGGGEFIRLSNFRIFTKQFMVYADQAKKVRVGTQRYLLEATSEGEITSNIYLNQNMSEATTLGPLFPDPDTSNSSLTYTNIVFTSPELESGLSTASSRLWHRVSTSLIGDTFQLELTLSDEQMRDPDRTFVNSDVILHAIVVDTYPAGTLV